MKRIILLMILTFFVNVAFGQNNAPCRSSGIIMGNAVNLPKPPARIWENCNCKFDKEIEQVTVQISINEEGIVEEVNAISGHIFLRQVSEQAARNSRFSPTILCGERKKTFGEIVYSYNLMENSIYLSNYERILLKEITNLGIINSSATSLPMPKRPPSGTYRVSNHSSIGVQVKVDLQTGTVIEATAIYGFPLFRKPAKDAALQAKFDFKGKWSYAKFGIGVLDYKVKDFIGYEKIIETQKIVNNRAIYLPKPMVGNIVHPKHLRLSKNEIVQVEVVIDEQGNVINTNAISGHPLLRSVCESAARRAKFHPTWDVGKIRVNGVLVYTIKPNGKVEM